MSVGKVLTKAILKNMLNDMMVYRGVCSNIDECKTWGIYWINSETSGDVPSNFPEPTLEVMVRNGIVIQRLTSSDARVAIRVSKSQVWSSWKLQSSTGLMGGVKRCTSFTREQKGGWRYEYASKGSDGREAERTASECNDIPRTLRGLERMSGNRDLVGGCQHEKQNRTVEHGLRHTGGACAAQEWSQYRNLPAHHLMAMHVVRDAAWRSGLLGQLETSDPDPSVNLLTGKEVVAA